MSNKMEHGGQANAVNDSLQIVASIATTRGSSTATLSDKGGRADIIFSPFEASAPGAQKPPCSVLQN
jgi:hypothetical protein